MQNRCEFTLTDCINVFHGEITPQTDAILRLGEVSSSGRHIKCPNVKANPLLSPRLLLYWLRKHLAGISLAVSQLSLSGLEPVARNGNSGWKMGKK